jgi:hypothetical protein
MIAMVIVGPLGLEPGTREYEFPFPIEDEQYRTPHLRGYRGVGYVRTISQE